MFSTVCETASWLHESTIFLLKKTSIMTTSGYCALRNLHRLTYQLRLSTRIGCFLGLDGMMAINKQFAGSGLVIGMSELMRLPILLNRCDLADQVFILLYHKQYSQFALLYLDSRFNTVKASHLPSFNLKTTCSILLLSLLWLSMRSEHICMTCPGGAESPY